MRIRALLLIGDSARVLGCVRRTNSTLGQCSITAATTRQSHIRTRWLRARSTAAIFFWAQSSALNRLVGRDRGHRAGLIFDRKTNGYCRTCTHL
jgi:hypothetical protein